MKKISIWANNHKWGARFLIIGGFLLLNCLGITTGSLLSDIQFSISPFVMFMLIVIVLAACLLYPAKSLKGKKLCSSAFYIRQKACDFILIISTFGMVVYISNREEISLFNTSSANAATVIIKKDETYKPISEFSKTLKDENGKKLKLKERKKLLKKQLKGIKKANDLSKGEKIALMILSIAAAIGLGALLAAAACSIACGGAEALAIVVAFAGYGILTMLLILAIRAIVGKKGKPKAVAEIPANAG